MLSRVADSLYWLSRYLERAEHTARLLDVNLNLMLDQSAAASQQRLQRMLLALRHPWPTQGEIDIYQITEALTFDVDNRNSIVACINSARENARPVREQISSEMWEQLNQLFLNIKGTNIRTIWNAQPWEFFRSIKEGSQLFQGLTDSTMNHGEGWHFLEVGRFLERANAVTIWLDAHFAAGKQHTSAAEEYLDWVGLLRSCTAFESYCKVYTADLRPQWVAEFLLLNPEFPHSVRFSVDMVQGALATIAETTDTPKSGRVNRLSGRLKATLSFGQIDEIMAGGLHPYFEDLKHQFNQLHTAIYQTFVTYPIDAALGA
jgi:uncharacterized alpha-E superfamily protein